MNIFQTLFQVSVESQIYKDNYFNLLLDNGIFSKMNYIVIKQSLKLKKKLMMQSTEKVLKEQTDYRLIPILEKKACSKSHLFLCMFVTI